MTDPKTPEPTPVPAPVLASDPAINVPAPARAAEQKRSLRWVTPTLALVAALAVGVVGGVFIGKAGAGNAGARGQFTSGQFTNGQAGPGARQSGARNSGFTSGTIVSIDGDTITIKAQDGSTKKVTTGSDTTVTKTAKTTVGALKKGQTITVIGEADGDEAVKATTISEGAGLRGGFAARPDDGTSTSDSGN
ncbi:hypothetical protein [Parafrigoribacterium soli]|uniref:hypothetical protein n=1 Tax=Parafrigoribacterium soli TaxID=3144663 RepID=UPI0032F0403F